MASTIGHLTALARAASRQLAAGLRLASFEAAQWRARATCIPDPRLRDDALCGIDGKRANIHGAALFWTLPQGRSRTLIRLLVAFEIMADYLDCVDEHVAKGPQLQRAMVDAFDRSSMPCDYYHRHPSREDGCYLQMLLDVCRSSCMRLPSFQAVEPHLGRAARLSEVQTLNHRHDSYAREGALRAWAETNAVGCDTELSWFERTAAASAWLTVLALLAFAADAGRSRQEASKLYAAYLPWISLSATMLDSYGDVTQDRITCEHSYIAHYPAADVAQRVAAIVARSAQEANALHQGGRHVVIVTTMTAMYLSKDTVRLRSARDTKFTIARAGGPLTVLLLPVLRAWRICYHQQAA
jgi:tetraprenyl-beta-curcumene synthase